MTRHPYHKPWLKLLVAIFLIVQLSVQAHAIKHDGVADSSCISCTVGGSLGHGTTGSATPELVVCALAITPDIPYLFVPAASRGTRHLARAPPAIP